MNESGQLGTKASTLAPGGVLLRGKLWSFTNIKWNRAEPDVGIMSDYPDGFDLEDADGNLWDWDKDPLTDEEDTVVNAALGELTHEPDPPEPDGECYRGGEYAASVQRELAEARKLK